MPTGHGANLLEERRHVMSLRLPTQDDIAPCIDGVNPFR